MGEIRNVLVAGRSWRDQILLNAPSGVAAVKRLERRQTLVMRLAGTAVLHSFITACCEAMPATTVVRPRLPDEDDPSGGSKLTQSYWIWSAFPRTRFVNEFVWRLQAGLGYVDGGLNTDYANLYGRDHPLDELHTLVLDDNDFHQTAGTSEDLWGSWPAIGKDCPVPEHIVLRAGASLRDTTRWEKLSATYADKLTVVIPLTALRSWGATISPALSWDRTLEQTWYELAHNSALSSLWECRRVVVHFGASGAVVFKRGAAPMCVYDPIHLEGSLESTWPGDFPGYSSIFTTAIVVALAGQSENSLVNMLARAIGAVRENHRIGGGAIGQDVASSWQHLTDLVAAHLVGDDKTDSQGLHILALGKSVPGRPEAETVNLAALISQGMNYDEVAHDVVARGPAVGLSKFPRLQFGRYWSVDRAEIERLNTLKTLLQEFASGPTSSTPLSIAVFGPPGAGKSYSVKEVSSAVFGAKVPFLTFNLSELKEDELPAAFHLIRDERLRGNIPVVFWDEFDTGALKWLKHFLAPMNDAEFWESGRMHPVGKAVFVFAGSMASTFLEFRTLVAKNSAEYPITLKATDFISRLGGFFDVRGPGVISGGIEDGMAKVRRALLLSASIEQLHPQLIVGDEEKSRACIDRSIVAAFLGVREYLHGARSLRAVISMSSLRGRSQFGPSMLPPADQLALHVSDDFLRIVQGYKVPRHGGKNI